MKKVLLFVLICATALSVASCSKNAPPARCIDILSAICDEVDLPDGRIYSVGNPSPDGRLTEQLMSLLFTESVLGYFRIREDGGSAVDDCAVFISTSGSAVEFAVFRCTKTTVCTSVARICLSRLDVLRRSKNSEENKAHLDSGNVYILDNYVILAVSSEAASAIKAAKLKVK